MPANEIRYISDSAPVSVTLEDLSFRIADVSPRGTINISTKLNVKDIALVPSEDASMSRAHCLVRLFVELYEDNNADPLAVIDISVKTLVEGVSVDASDDEHVLGLFTDAAMTGYSFATNQILGITAVSRMRGLYLPIASREGIAEAVREQLKHGKDATS